VTAIRTLAFAELDAPSLGVAWIPRDGAAAVIGIRVGSARRVATAHLHDGAGPEPWRLEGDGVSLLFGPIGPAAHGGAPDAGIDSTDQLCEVTGTIVLDGSERAISCPGSRTNLEARFELAASDSFRQTAGWFQPAGRPAADGPAADGPVADGLSLVSYRPSKSRGQDTDLVAAAVLDPERAPPVADPRLSTTYDAAGLPARVGLELWFEPDDSSEDSEGDEQRHFPRRAAAESVGEPIGWEVAGFRLHAALLRWHSRGSDGAGMYLLGRRG
jgi:hypothetical protein